MEDENLSTKKAFDVLGRNKWCILDIDWDEVREAFLAAFFKREDMRTNSGTLPLSYKFSVEAYKSVAYITREFVRKDCQLKDALLVDSDCDRLIAEV